MKREETIDHNIRIAWHGISRIYNQQAAKYGGSMSIGFALLSIHTEEGTPVTKIGPQMGLEPRSLSRLLKSMEEKKLIKRESDKKDKRSVRIVLTNEGRKRRDKAKETVLQFNTAVREEIPDQKLNVFFDVLQSLNRIIEKNEIYKNN
jgi:DNA-binding MarR family transcriptional regulator